MHSSVVQHVAIANPVRSAKYRVYLQYDARVFAVALHEAAFDSAAYRIGFEYDVQRSTFHRGMDEISLRFLLSGTGLPFSSFLKYTLIRG